MNPWFCRLRWQRGGNSRYVKLMISKTCELIWVSGFGEDMQQRSLAKDFFLKIANFWTPCKGHASLKNDQVTTPLVKALHKPILWYFCSAYTVDIYLIYKYAISLMFWWGWRFTYYRLSYNRLSYNNLAIFKQESGITGIKKQKRTEL